LSDVRVVVAHAERATLQVGDVFLKIDGEPGRLEREVVAMALSPLPTPEILWRKPSVLALGALPGKALGVLGEASTASSEAWVATGTAVRALHDAPLPPWSGQTPEQLTTPLDEACDWLVTAGVVPADLVAHNRRIAERVIRPWTPVFTHGDLQITHVFVDGDRVTGVLDWSEGRPGDAMFDLAILTLGHEERLEEVLAGYGSEVDRDVIRGWWSWRSLTAAQWLIEHGFDPDSPGAEFDVLRAAR
jgi:aminoglycoside phosphotransferase